MSARGDGGMERDTHLQHVHEVFEDPLPLRLQRHVLEHRLFEETLSDLSTKGRVS